MQVEEEDDEAMEEEGEEADGAWGFRRIVDHEEGEEGLAWLVEWALERNGDEVFGYDDSWEPTSAFEGGGLSQVHSYVRTARLQDALNAEVSALDRRADRSLQDDGAELNNELGRRLWASLGYAAARAGLGSVRTGFGSVLPCLCQVPCSLRMLKLLMRRGLTHRVGRGELVSVAFACAKTDCSCVCRSRVRTLDQLPIDGKSFGTLAARSWLQTWLGGSIPGLSLQSCLGMR